MKEKKNTCEEQEEDKTGLPMHSLNIVNPKQH